MNIKIYKEWKYYSAIINPVVSLKQSRHIIIKIKDKLDLNVRYIIKLTFHRIKWQGLNKMTEDRVLALHTDTQGSFPILCVATELFL